MKIPKNHGDEQDNHWLDDLNLDGTEIRSAY
jgi:hypothetical protein